MRLWTIKFQDENAGAFSMTGLAETGEQAIERARKAAVEIWDAVEPSFLTLERGPEIVFGIDQ